MIETWLTGIYPRSEVLIEATRLNVINLNDLFRKEKNQDVKMQTKFGLKYISDPLLDWNDHLRPFTTELEGVEEGALSRFYENNTFYRQPIIKKRIKTKGKILKKAFNWLPKKKCKIDLMDPYTFADLSDNRFYKNNELIDDIASIYIKEINSLPSRFEMVQFNAPSLALTESKQEIETAKHAINRISKKTKRKICLNLCFGDVSNRIDEFMDFKIDILGIDFISTKIENLEENNIDKTLLCGIIDAQNTKLETKTELLQIINNINKKLNPPQIAITNNRDFEFLPKKFAERKLRNFTNASKYIQRRLQ